jgi:hypothetical protein
MRPYSKVKPKKGTSSDPYSVVPIPPKSVVRLTATHPRAPGWKEDIGRLFRIGYYGELDGLDCVWLVNDLGEYEQTTDHEFLFACFDIIVISDEADLYGKKRPILPPVRKAERVNRRSRNPG